MSKRNPPHGPKLASFLLFPIAKVQLSLNIPKYLVENNPTIYNCLSHNTLQTHKTLTTSRFSTP